tara:strand:- start:378 stop:638 length:261 start_codon:yes stop_codon:yes gene_type:complete
MSDYDYDDYDLTHTQDAGSVFADIDEDAMDMYDHDRELRLEQLEYEIAKLEGLIILASIEDEVHHVIDRLEDELDLLTMNYNEFKA